MAVKPAKPLVGVVAATAPAVVAAAAGGAAGSGGGPGAGGGSPAGRSPLERLCQARRARRAARKLREQQRLAPKASSNLDVLERHTREVLRRLEVGPLEEVSHRCHGNARMIPRQSRSDIASWFVKTSERFKLGRNDVHVEGGRNPIWAHLEALSDFKVPVLIRC